MRIQKSELVQKLNKLKGIVPKRPQNLALQGILFKDGYLIANNLEMLIRSKLTDNSEEAFIIPSKAFELINNLPEAEIDITANSDNLITIRVPEAKIRNTYSSISPNEFPLPDLVKSENKFTVNSNILLNSIKKVSYAIADESVRETTKALCLQAKEGTLNFVGCDGRVVAWNRVDYSGAEFELLIPKQTAEKLLSIGLNGEVSINYNKNGVLFSANEYEIYTRIIDGEYINYRSMFKVSDKDITVDRIQLHEAVSRARACSKDHLTSVNLHTDGNTLNINIKDDLTDYSEDILLKEKNVDVVDINFNPKLIIETLKAFDSKYVTFQYAGTKSPMIITAAPYCFVAVIAPVVATKRDR